MDVLISSNSAGLLSEGWYHLTLLRCRTGLGFEETFQFPSGQLSAMCPSPGWHPVPCPCSPALEPQPRVPLQGVASLPMFGVRSSTYGSVIRFNFQWIKQKQKELLQLQIYIMCVCNLQSDFLKCFLTVDIIWSTFRSLPTHFLLDLI